MKMLNIILVLSAILTHGEAVAEVPWNSSWSGVGTYTTFYGEREWCKTVVVDISQSGNTLTETKKIDCGSFHWDVEIIFQRVDEQLFLGGSAVGTVTDTKIQYTIPKGRNIYSATLLRKDTKLYYLDSTLDPKINKRDRLSATLDQ